MRSIERVGLYIEEAGVEWESWRVGSRSTKRKSEERGGICGD